MIPLPVHLLAAIGQSLASNAHVIAWCYHWTSVHHAYCHYPPGR